MRRDHGCQSQLHHYHHPPPTTTTTSSSCHDHHSQAAARTTSPSTTPRGWCQRLTRQPRRHGGPRQPSAAGAFTARRAPRRAAATSHRKDKEGPAAPPRLPSPSGPTGSRSRPPWQSIHWQPAAAAAAGLQRVRTALGPPLAAGHWQRTPH